MRVTDIRIGRSGIAFIGIAAMLASAPFAMAAPLRPGVAVLTGTPPRALTDPASIVSQAKPDAEPLPLDDLHYLRSSWFADWAPDGKSIVMTSDLTGRANLWSVPIAGGFPLQLQQSEDRAYAPKVSPDGRWVVYQSDLGGREIYDMFALPMAGGKPVNLTNTPEVTETGAFAFSPDSRLVAFVARDARASSGNIAILSLGDRRTRVLTQEKAEGIYWSVVCFTPDGRHVIANRATADFAGSAIWRIDVETGAMTPISGGGKPAFEAATDISPDGRWLSTTVENDEGLQQAALIELTTGKRSFMHRSAWPQTGGHISPDGRSVLVLTNVDGSDEVSLYDIAAKAARPLPLPKGRLTDYQGKFPAFSPAGDTLLMPVSSGHATFDYWTYDLNSGASARMTQVTRLGLASVAPANLPRTSTVTYKSKDGTPVSALLWTPYNLKRDGSAPVVVLAHGGPTGQTYNDFDPTAAALASRGYFVIAPNPRGSTGYGRAFQLANQRDLGGRDLEDVAAAADFLVASGYADRRRIGITGGSYGGYMTLMAVAKMPDFWAAGVELYGIVNWRSMWERGSPALREYQRILLGDPAKDKDVYDRTSPLTYLTQTKAPLLVLQGDNDIRVPRYEAEQVVEVLKGAGKTVDAAYYPEEGHGFSKRENQIDALRRTVDWFDRYLKKTGEK